MGKTSPESEISNYIEQLKTNKDWRIRSKAASALGKFNQDTNQDTNNIIIPALIAALNDQDEIVRLRVTFSLIKIGLPAVPYLIETLEAENESARASAEFALRKNSFDIYPILSNELTSSNQQVRSSATSIFIEMAKDIEGRPRSQKPSILELKQAVSALEEAVRDIREFLKLQNPLAT
ncbi:MAG: HEAT repeat domain-containing protein, partial [Microcoleaceae cyanobacterium]